MKMAKRTTHQRPPWTKGNRLFGYDPEKLRVWVGGQRLHHGLTGCLLAAAGVAGLTAHRGHPVRWTLVGAALMAHDWHDREVWFAPGPQNQP